MSLEDMRRRLEQLNRGPLPTGGPAGPAVAPTAMERAATTVSDREPFDCGAAGLERLIDGEELAVGGGRCYRICRRLSRCWTADSQIGRRTVEALESATSRIDTLDAELAEAVRAGAEALLFVDLETCGFAGTPVFLIGTMFVAKGDLVVEQLLARNYEEEPAIIARFAELGGTGRVLVTFNGKSFDWPFLRDRAAVARIDLNDPAAHCDLLHAARRRYRELLPDCKLQTLETYVCRRRRIDDLPGSEIPRAYHEFVRCGDARELRQIVHHNFLDLVTLADLLVKLLDARQGQRGGRTCRPTCPEADSRRQGVTEEPRAGP